MPATDSLTLDQALADLGVRDDTLTAGEQEMLDLQGYVPLTGILTPEHLTALRNRCDELVRLEGDAAGSEVHQEEGTARLADLVNKGEVFDICYQHPRVLAAIRRVLGDFHLSSLNARAALPGHGHQGLHPDWSTPVEPGEYFVCNSIWLLDDFTPDNGATRAVPGSHRTGRLPADELADLCGRHPHETLLTAPAGTVVVFNAHVWHGGTLNRSDAPRRAIHSYFTRRSQPQQTVQRDYIRPETLERLSPAAKLILDV